MSKTAEIFIYDVIGYDWWTGDGVTAKSINQQLKAFNADKDVSDITVRINSPGGSVFEGVAIYNLMQQNSKPVNTIIDGIAYSMGAIIAMAGKNRSMAKNATMLLHNCSGIAVGNVRDMKQTIEMMDKIDTGLSESIAEVTGMTVKEVQDKWMNYDDHTLAAREAKDAKLIHDVLDYSAEIPAGIANMSIQELYVFYAEKNGRQVKENFVDKIVNKVRDLITPTNHGHKPDNNSTDMDFSKSLALLNGPLTTEQSAIVKMEIEAFTGVNEKFTKAELDAQIKAANDASEVAAKKLQDDLKASQDKVTELQAIVDKAPDTEKDDTVVKDDKTGLKGAAEWNKPDYSWNKNAAKLA